MAKLSSLITRGFFKQLSKFTPQQYFSLPNTIQSSVGLIFRFPPQYHIESYKNLQQVINVQKQGIQDSQLFFVQRAGYVKDKNAYNVVFPGGQCDHSESDLTACRRELKEEINIDVESQCVYAGQLPRNFYYLKKRGKQVHISCHIYVLRTSQLKWEPKLNPDELRQFRWVSIDSMLNPINYKERNEIKLGVFERMPKIAAYIAKTNITNVSMPELDLGMSRNLWGLTLWIWSFAVQMAYSHEYALIVESDRKLLNKLVAKMKEFNLTFKPYSPYKYPSKMLASGWHYLYRVKPFTYDSLQIKKGYVHSLSSPVLLISALLIVLIFLRFF